MNEFVDRCRWFHQPMTRGGAKMFALPHRLNTRLRIIGACSGEVIAVWAHYLNGIAAAGDHAKQA